jgi:hypothetical protein
MAKASSSRRMTPKQYETHCRDFLAHKLKIDPDLIKEGRLIGSSRLGKELRHQIELYWTTSNGICEYLHIVNAKLRTAKVKLGEILLLEQVRDELHAHKAIMITNTDFTKGARDHAEDKRIALHIVKPIVKPIIYFSTVKRKKPDTKARKRPEVRVEYAHRMVFMQRDSRYVRRDSSDKHSKSLRPSVRDGRRSSSDRRR